MSEKPDTLTDEDFAAAYWIGPGKMPERTPCRETRIAIALHGVAPEVRTVRR